jgi:hypothetical protein
MPQVAMPLTNIAKEIYRLAIQDGHGDEDFSAIYAYQWVTGTSTNPSIQQAHDS